MANQFAANLLLPSYLLSPILRRQVNLSWTFISEISNIFDTSLTATAIRVVESNEFPAILVCTKNSKRKWFRRAGQVPMKWRLLDYVENESSAATITRSNYDVKLSDKSEISAEAWFELVSEEYDSYVIVEQSCRITNEEILTLIILTDNMLDN